MNFKCSHCNASFWKQERLTNAYLCYQNGKEKMPYLLERSQTIKIVLILQTAEAKTIKENDRDGERLD